MELELAIYCVNDSLENQMKTIPAVLLAIFCTAAIVTAIIVDAVFYEGRWVYQLWVTVVVVAFVVLIKPGPILIATSKGNEKVKALKNIVATLVIGLMVLAALAVLKTPTFLVVIGAVGAMSCYAVYLQRRAQDL